MKVRFNRIPLYLTLTLVPIAVVGCGEESKDLSVKPSPEPIASKPFPKPSVPATLNAPSKVALTRPTNPDDRLRVIKSGRPDPFGSVGPVALIDPPGGGFGGSSVGGSRFSPRSPSPSSVSLSGFKGGNFGPGASNGKSGTAPSLTLPSLPKAPEPANVKVTGVLVVGGAPHAIVQAPDEPTSRTVGIGDSLSGGRLIVKDIDMSNRAEPMVVFQQGSIQFSVAVGREPVLIASAPTTRAVRGLYPLQLR
jgi:hypothetical protein